MELIVFLLASSPLLELSLLYDRYARTERTLLMSANTFRKRTSDVCFLFHPRMLYAYAVELIPLRFLWREVVYKHL
jgi:hypothetical protein